MKSYHWKQSADAVNLSCMTQPNPIEYSERAMALPGSPIRALLSSARGELPLDLGGGIPDPVLFPRELMANAAENLLTKHSALVLQYAPTEGLAPLRERIALRLMQRGCEIAPDQILITHGSQHALATVAALLTSPTRSVALEQPVYPGAEQAFALAQAPRMHLPVTEQGWAIDAIAGRKPAAIYVIANHQNPTGRRANREQREQLAAFARAVSAYVIEDDAYGELDFTETDTQIRMVSDVTAGAASSRPLIADLPERGILLGTFSKTLCPGLRVGWIAAPRPLIEPLVRMLQASSLQPGTFAQHLALGV
ncbi:MAG TPA: PLP-dependent aminotransferase family protein, partial [Polyangiaceae bacterium]